MIGPGRMGYPLTSPRASPFIRRPQSGFSKSRGFSGRVGQRFPPREGSDCRSGDAFFHEDSDISYAHVLSPPPLVVLTTASVS